MDYFSLDSIIYFLILTLTIFFAGFYGYYILLNITESTIIYISYFIFMIAIYIALLGIYYLSWTIENIVILILFVSILLSFVIFMIFFNANTICSTSEPITTKNIIEYAMIILEFIIIYLAFYKMIYKPNDNFDIYDTLRFILILIIVRTMYYFIEKYSLVIQKSLLDISIVVIFFIYSKIFYNVFTQK